MHGEDEKCSQNYSWKALRLLRKPTCSWEDDIKMDIRDTGFAVDSEN